MMKRCSRILMAGCMAAAMFGILSPATACDKESSAAGVSQVAAKTIEECAKTCDAAAAKLASAKEACAKACDAAAAKLVAAKAECQAVCDGAAAKMTAAVQQCESKDVAAAKLVAVKSECQATCDAAAAKLVAAKAECAQTCDAATAKMVAAKSDCASACESACDGNAKASLTAAKGAMGCEASRTAGREALVSLLKVLAMQESQGHAAFCDSGISAARMLDLVTNENASVMVRRVAQKQAESCTQTCDAGAQKVALSTDACASACSSAKAKPVASKMAAACEATCDGNATQVNMVKNQCPVEKAAKALLMVSGENKGCEEQLLKAARALLAAAGGETETAVATQVNLGAVSAKEACGSGKGCCGGCKKAD